MQVFRLGHGQIDHMKIASIREQNLHAPVPQSTPMIDPACCKAGPVFRYKLPFFTIQQPTRLSGKYCRS